MSETRSPKVAWGTDPRKDRSPATERWLGKPLERCLLGRVCRSRAGPAGTVGTRRRRGSTAVSSDDVQEENDGSPSGHWGPRGRDLKQQSALLKGRGSGVNRSQPGFSWGAEAQGPSGESQGEVERQRECGWNQKMSPAWRQGPTFMGKPELGLLGETGVNRGEGRAGVRPDGIWFKVGDLGRAQDVSALAHSSVN